MQACSRIRSAASDGDPESSCCVEVSVPAMQDLGDSFLFLNASNGFRCGSGWDRHPLLPPSSATPAMPHCLATNPQHVPQPDVRECPDRSVLSRQPFERQHCDPRPESRRLADVHLRMSLPKPYQKLLPLHQGRLNAIPRSLSN